MHKGIAGVKIIDGKEVNVAQAKIISTDVRMGLMTIECPNDIQQHDVPIGTKEFKCPVDGTLLIIS